jgi:hypothetical protein
MAYRHDALIDRQRRDDDIEAEVKEPGSGRFIARF